jgi:uncharacterized protein YbcI
MTLDEPVTQAVNDDNARERATSQLMRVSAAMTRIYKDQFGRGPERVYSHFAGPDAIICFLENTLTPVERTLVTLDEHQRLRDMRMLFQYAAETQFRLAVEEITGRRVVAFVSGIDVTADVATETFTLEPASRAGGGSKEAPTR